MQYTAARAISRDSALDYLFQESIEEQLEALNQLKYDEPERRVTFLERLSLWFRGDRTTEDDLPVYLEEENN